MIWTYSISKNWPRILRMHIIGDLSWIRLTAVVVLTEYCHKTTVFVRDPTILCNRDLIICRQFLTLKNNATNFLILSIFKPSAGEWVVSKIRDAWHMYPINSDISSKYDATWLVVFRTNSTTIKYHKFPRKKVHATRIHIRSYKFYEWNRTSSIYYNGLYITRDVTELQLIILIVHCNCEMINWNLVKWRYEANIDHGFNRRDEQKQKKINKQEQGWEI